MSQSVLRRQNRERLGNEGATLKVDGEGDEHGANLHCSPNSPSILPVAGSIHANNMHLTVGKNCGEIGWELRKKWVDYSPVHFSRIIVWHPISQLF